MPVASFGARRWTQSVNHRAQAPRAPRGAFHSHPRHSSHHSQRYPRPSSLSSVSSSPTFISPVVLLAAGIHLGDGAVRKVKLGEPWARPPEPLQLHPRRHTRIAHVQTFRFSKHALTNGSSPFSSGVAASAAGPIGTSVSPSLPSCLLPESDSSAELEEPRNHLNHCPRPKVAHSQVREWRCDRVARATA